MPTAFCYGDRPVHLAQGCFRKDTASRLERMLFPLVICIVIVMYCVNDDGA